jgi:RNA polymerase sigma-70 factor (ECF subfamily)
MTETSRERIFRELFAGHKARIERLCFGYLGSAEELEDLFQEIMTNVWNSLPGFRGDSRIETWLYRIAVNTALLYRRKRVRTEPLSDFADASAGPQDDLERRERLAALRKAIAALPEQERLVVTLLLEGFSYREIAEITGITVNYVGVKISRIKRMLEEALTEVCHGAV